MTRPQLAYRVNDADQHYYEPDDCFTRHIEAKFRNRTMRIERTEPGRPGRMFVGDERCDFFSVGAADSIGAPGIMKAFLQGLTEEGGSPSLHPIDGLAVPEFVDAKARLARMDEQGVESALMLPTAGVGIEPQLRKAKHREALWPSLRAFNRWLEEDWGYGRDGRLYGAPLLTLVDLPQAQAELERVLSRGARFVVLAAGPVEGRSPGEPEFDPFWARCQEARVNVVFHIGATTFGEMYSRPWGLRASPPSHRHSLMEYHLAFTERPVADTLASLVADNLFGRFPELRLLSVEFGASWVAPLLTKLDKLARLYSKDMWRFGAPPLAPSETFRRNVWVAPFYEDDVPALVRTLGAERVLNGSDYPHPEGLAWPVEFIEELGGLSDAQVRRIMRDNFAELAV
jgi:predicted TIM-barrel fold metal-dependent hydrolase